MSVQFGKWNLDGLPLDREYLTKAGEMLAPYGPDGGSAYIEDSVGILYRAFHTTKESRREAQPSVTPSGAVLCWDGRLDNRKELLSELGEKVTAESTDLVIIEMAYQAWGTKCFAKLIGDWALSVWDPKSRSVILAKDPIGTRHIYYSSDHKQITWSTILDPLVLLAGKTFTLEEEYIAGWLSFFPATHLTPYVGIHSVPPSCFVRLEPGRRAVSKYWDFDPSKRIRYRTDDEYEEHFRQVFKESVRRRLRSDRPILAELSGGMDSSSIVCMADQILAREEAETPRLDTISYYDDSEPNWNERPYFSKVEEKRGRTGCHVDVGCRELFKFRFQLQSEHFAATPSSVGYPDEAATQIALCMASQGNRVLFSGIGGDEVLGGVPTPTSELEDLVAKGHLKRLTYQLKIWALSKRKPWFHLLFDAARAFFPPALVGAQKNRRPVFWLNQAFVKRNRRALQGYETRVKMFGPLPSFQENVSTFQALQRQLGCDAVPCESLSEKRYPYLDRGMLEFLYSVPREQFVRPGQRRSLMRRALAGIIPDELLNRKRKAYVARAPLAVISSDWIHFAEMSQRMLVCSLGIVEADKFYGALQKAGRGQEVPIVAVMRTLRMESWLKRLARSNLLSRRLEDEWGESHDLKKQQISITSGKLNRAETT